MEKGGADDADTAYEMGMAALDEFLSRGIDPIHERTLANCVEDIAKGHPNDYPLSEDAWHEIFEWGVERSMARMMGKGAQR